MNWTGGTRVRHNRPSSDTNRLQKRYFAKVRAAQNSFPHKGPPSTPGSKDPVNSQRKRKSLLIPALDIIVAKERAEPQGKEAAAKKPKEIHAFNSTPASFAGSLGIAEQASEGLKSKKQFLLKKDDWVCTTLARPLILRGQGGRSQKRSGAVPMKATEPLSLGYFEPPTVPINCNQVEDYRSEARKHSPTSYPSLKRSYQDIGNKRRRVGGNICNLSDGGYVQIGGSTQADNRTASPHSLAERDSVGREMSDISEETMLFDLNGQQRRYDIPFQLSPPPDQHLPDLQTDIYYGNSRREHTGRDSDISHGFPSSPLAPYSQNIRNHAALSSRNPFIFDGPESVDDLIEEIEEVAAESSSSTVMSTIYLHSEPPPVPPSEILLQPMGKDKSHIIAKHQEELHGGYQASNRFQTLPYNQQNPFSLSRLFEEEIEHTQELSLVTYASSGSASTTGSDEGGDWVLGSNVSLASHRTDEIETNDPAHELDDWGNLAVGDILAESKDTKLEKTKDDVQRYLGEAGLWEKHSGDNEVESPPDDDGIYNDFYNFGGNDATVAEILKPVETSDLGDFLAATPSGSFLSPEREKGALWVDFVEDPSKGAIEDKLKNKSHNTKEISDQPHRSKDIDNQLAPLDFGGGEDRAWRMFVLEGLEGKSNQEECLKALVPHKPKMLRRSSIKPMLQFSKADSPEIQLPSLLQHSSSPPPPDLHSVAGATVGSGSLLGLEDVAGSQPALSGLESINNDLSSSPTASPVALVYIHPARSENRAQQKGKERPVTSWLGKDSSKNRDGAKRTKVNREEVENDDIEEW